MAPPRIDGGNSDGALTVSSMMKEIQVLKDKFKNDDEDHCELWEEGESRGERLGYARIEGNMYAGEECL